MNPNSCLVLNYGVATTASFFLNEKLPASFLGWEDTVDCYNLAVKRVESNFENTNYRDLNNEIHFYLWEGSFKWIKYDALYYEICWFFLIEILNKSVSKYPITKIRIEFDKSNVPIYFIQEIISKFNLEIEYSENIYNQKNNKNYFHHLFTFFRESAIQLRNIFQNLKKPRTELSKGKVILFNLGDWKTHRYGSLIPFLETKYPIFGLLPKLFINEKVISLETNIINPYSFFSLLDLPKIIFDSVKLFYIQKKCFKQIEENDYLFANLWKQSFFELFLVQIQSQAIDKVLKSINPKIFISDGHFNGSYHRRVWFQCKNNNVKVLSLTQKIIQNRNIAYRINFKFDSIGLPDYFNVNTIDSKESLQRMGVPSQQIRVGNYTEILKKSSNEKIVNDCTDLNNLKKVSIVLLLENDIWINLKMVNWVLKLKYVGNVNLLIKPHPSLPINCQKDLLEILVGIEFINVSSKSWDSFIERNKTIAFAINTTAVLEAYNLGALIIWLNHLSDKSIAISNIIDSIGLRFNREEELIVKLNSLFSNQLLIEEELGSQNRFHPFCDFKGSLNEEVERVISEIE